MQAPTALLSVFSALTLLDSTQAIKCFSCVYAAMTVGDIVFGIAQDPNCGDPFDETKVTSLTGPDTVPYPTLGIVFNPQHLDQLHTENISVSSAGQSKVYCATIIGTHPQLGPITMRGFSSELTLDLSGCYEVEDTDARHCLCDRDECNSTSGLQPSFGLYVAAVLLLASNVVQ